MRKTVLLLTGLMALSLLLSALAEDMPVIDWEPPRAYETLRRGDSGKAVEALQIMLVEHHYMRGAAGGTFGSLTKLAVTRVQADAGFPQTGVADPRAQAYLEGHYGVFEPKKDANALMYALTFDESSHAITARIKNTGAQRITGFELMFDQCNADKEALGTFHGDRNDSGSDHYSSQTFDVSLDPGVFVSVEYPFEGIRLTPVNGGPTDELSYFEDGALARFILISFTTEDGKSHKTYQALYCPFR